MPRRRSTSCNAPDDNDATVVAKKPDPPEQYHHESRRSRRRSITDNQQTANKRADLTSSFDKKNTQEDGSRRRRLSLSLSDILKKSDTSSKTLDKSTPRLSQVRRILEKKRSERRLDPSSHPADHHASFDKYLNHQVENYLSHKDDFLYYVGQYETSDNDKFVYDIGQTLDNPTHSLRFSSKKQASRLLAGIPMKWPLFVKRTDRHWTYGILVERTCDEINGELKSVVVSLNDDERRTRTKVLDSTKWEQCLMMINLRTVLVLY